MSYDYAFGKTPLWVRIDRYVEFFQPTDYIPIHTKEYNQLTQSPTGARELSRLERFYRLPIVPLGARPAVGNA